MRARGRVQAGARLVDFVIMRAGATFAEVLDAALGAERETPASHQPDVRYSPSGYPFLFLNGQTPASRPPLAARVVRGTFDTPVAARGPRVSPARPVPRQAPHHLSPPEQRAFLDLVRHGAELSDDFTLAELQRAFRALARRHHPDRHPGASPAEQSRLSAIFISVAASYRRLLESART